MTETKRCPVVVSHPAHEWRYGRCPGKSSQEVTAEAMRRKGGQLDRVRHLIEAHGLTVSPRQYASNMALWEKVDEKLHESYDLGYAHGLRDA